MSKWILVTGGAGFIGTNLCSKLLSQGKKVFCVDNFSTSQESNLDQFASNPNFRSIKADITQNFSHLGLEQYDLESIYNLACPASPPLYQALALETMAVNSIGMKNLLELAKERKIPILQSSTSEVYGEPSVSPQPETYRGNVNCHGPRSCYDEGKRFAEALCFEYIRLFKVDVRIVRIFNTYGPWLNPQDGRVVSNFMAQAIQRKPITLYGRGNQSRSFCYVDDTVDGLIALMNAKRSIIENEDSPIFNIGNPIEITVATLANRIIALSGSQSKFEYQPLPTDDPTQRCPDISKAKRVLHWSPKTLLDDGLRKTIEHFTDILKHEKVRKTTKTFTTAYSNICTAQQDRVITRSQTAEKTRKLRTH